MKGKLFLVTAIVAVGILFFHGYQTVREEREQRQRFSMLFGIENYNGTENERRALGFNVLEKLEEVRQILESRQDQDGQLESTFINLCLLARDQGFNDEANQAKCP